MSFSEIPGRFISRSEEETRDFGRQIGNLLKKGDLLLLTGDLGAGKTQLVKGIARSLRGIPEECVTSPTFSIINVYEGETPLYHVDLYRIGGSFEELEGTGIFEIIDENGITVVEWGERIKNYLPSQPIIISISFLSEGERCITISR